MAQFLVDGTYEYIARRVGAEEAVHAAKLATESLGAQAGLVTRRIINNNGRAPCRGFCLRITLQLLCHGGSNGRYQAD